MYCTPWSSWLETVTYHVLLAHNMAAILSLLTTPLLPPPTTPLPPHILSCRKHRMTSNGVYSVLSALSLCTVCIMAELQPTSTTPCNLWIVERCDLVFALKTHKTIMFHEFARNLVNVHFPTQDQSFDDDEDERFRLSNQSQTPWPATEMFCIIVKLVYWSDSMYANCTAGTTVIARPASLGVYTPGKYSLHVPQRVGGWVADPAVV